jgi:hypothetical protein
MADSPIFDITHRVTRKTDFSKLVEVVKSVQMRAVTLYSIIPLIANMQTLYQFLVKK